MRQYFVRTLLVFVPCLVASVVVDERTATTYSGLEYEGAWGSHTKEVQGILDSIPLAHRTLSSVYFKMRSTRAITLQLTRHHFEAKLLEMTALQYQCHLNLLGGVFSWRLWTLLLLQSRIFHPLQS